MYFRQYTEYLYYWLDCDGTVAEGAAVQCCHPLLLPTSKRQRVAADVMQVALSAGGQLGVVVAPLMQTALLHMAPPRPQCRGLDEKAGVTGMLAALWRTSWGIQKPWQV